jgi:nicotinate-nucleotide--dimethylbenzimidazole phosphoribosyltransferase
MKQIQRTIDDIIPVDRSLLPRIQARLDNLTKPQGSLGRLEDFAARYCLITNTLSPVLGPKRVYVFAGDHGVVAEGVSAYPKEVTPQMVHNMTNGGAAINVLARHARVDVRVVDIGVAVDLAPVEGLISRKVRFGTGNIAQGPAMARVEAERAVAVGIELARQAHDEGVRFLCTGDMGIGNTTPSSALMAALLPCSVRDIVGRGTGIDDAALQRKIRTVEKALAVNNDRLSDPLDTLAAVGGLEIAGIAGIILGAASRRIPVVVDGFISSAGALVASRMAPATMDYLFFSHCSAEAGHRMFFEIMGILPILDLGLRLGEGTGAVCALPLIEAGVKVYLEMAAFDTAGVSNRMS